MKTIMEKEHGRLVKKLHVLYRKAGMSEDEKRVFLSNWGVAHTNELEVLQALKAVGLLDIRINPQAGELDKWRKRVMASVGGWLRTQGIKHDANYIKSIVARAAGAAGVASFNQIPLAQLRSAYYEFLHKQKTAKRADKLEKEVSLGKISLN